MVKVSINQCVFVKFRHKIIHGGEILAHQSKKDLERIYAKKKVKTTYNKINGRADACLIALASI